MNVEVNFAACGDDATEEPASPSADPTPTGSAEKKDAQEDNPDVQAGGPVRSVYCAAITSTQWVALPAHLRCDIILKAPPTVLSVHALDEEAIVLERRLED